MAERSVLISGASSGIGRATALYLEQQGWKVFAGVRTEAAALALQKASAGSLVTVTLDVTNERDIAAVARTIGPRLDALVNNAGIAVAAPLEFLPIGELRNQLEVNVVGQVALSQALIPALREARGRIVNITSIGGLVAGPMIGAYHASKFALEALTDTMRIELAPWGIEVVAVEPGQIATPIWSTSSGTSERILAGRDHEATALYGEQMAAARDSASKAERNGTLPIEVAKVVGRALAAAKPRTRYLVGKNARLAGRVVARLPDRTRDRLLRTR
jgi:NAD(P)-dependent dehydrogenase (short-subunit alcohol dehydrogenase family)